MKHSALFAYSAVRLLLALEVLDVHGHVFGSKLMSAFTQGPLRQSYTQAFPVPEVGSLHATYSGMPNSCEVQISVKVSSVNPSDRFPTVAQSLLPHVLGSDVAGEVVAAEPGCTNLNVGDRVWGDIGANTFAADGSKTKQLGGYGQYAVALESQLWQIPLQMSYQEAGSLLKVALTSYKALVWYAGAKNDTLWQRKPAVLILGGSGGCGTVAIQLAKAFGAGTITTTTSARNFQYCTDLGSTRNIDYKAQDWWAPSVIPDESMDVIYDTVGQPGTGDRAMSKLKRGGYYVTITGQLATHPKAEVQQHMFINSDTNLQSAPLLRELTALAEADHLRMPRIRSFGLDQVADAFALSAQGHVVGKLAINVEGSIAAVATEL